jgi:putative ABC transport system permease protein
MKKQMIIAGLKARPVRTAVSVLAVALEVMLILVVVGLTTGTLEETAKRTGGVGDIMVMPPNTAMLALTSNTMPVSLGALIAGLPGIQAVAPVQIYLNTHDNIEIIDGIDAPSFNAVSGGFRWIEGRLFNGPSEIVVDDVWAKSKNVRPGDEAELFGQKFKIAGIVDHGQSARVFMPLEGMQQFLGEKVGLFYVKVKDPQQVKAAVADIQKLLVGYKVLDSQEYISMMASTNLPGLREVLDTVVFVALCIGVLVIFLSMYTTITERTREIGILRSMGASKAFIVGLILQESLFLCFLGVIFGISGSFLVARLLHHVFPTMDPDITFSWVVSASMFAILSGIIGSFYPSLKAAAQDPVEALAYE